MTRPTLLAVSALPPWPTQNGYALRVDALLRGLADRWRIILLAPADGEGTPDPRPPALADRLRIPDELAGLLLAHPGHETRVRTTEVIREAVRRHRPELCLFWPGLEQAGQAAADAIPTVVDRIDCQALRAWRELWWDARGRERARSFADLVHAVRYERQMARRARATIVVGDDDARALRRIAGGSVIHAVPNGVDLGNEVGAESEQPTVVFSGVLGFRPNVDAARYLVHRIWPRVRRAVPEARLLLVGRRPSPVVRALAEEPGVEVHADVPDLRAVLATAWVCMAPMRSGSGIKNKVLEAWAVGRPVVLSRLAANGLRLDAATRSLVAARPAELADLTIRLLGAPEERQRIGAASRALALAEHGWQPAVTAFSAILEDARQPRESDPR